MGATGRCGDVRLTVCGSCMSYTLCTGKRAWAKKVEASTGAGATCGTCSASVLSGLLPALVAAPPPPHITQLPTAAALPVQQQDEDDLDALTCRLPRLQVRAVCLLRTARQQAVSLRELNPRHWGCTGCMAVLQLPVTQCPFCARQNRHPPRLLLLSAVPHSSPPAPCTPNHLPLPPWPRCWP